MQSAGDSAVGQLTSTVIGPESPSGYTARDLNVKAWGASRGHVSQAVVSNLIRGHTEAPVLIGILNINLTANHLQYLTCLVKQT